jgi:diguanylate cyclase (GGDEF)-like protein
MQLVAAPGGVRVLGRTTGFVHEPALLPRSVLPREVAPGEGRPSGDPAALDAALGFEAQWSIIALPGDPEGWVAIGAPGGVPDEAVVAVQSVTNQIALALRASRAHSELTAQARVDPLTGLANRAAFTAALEAERRDPRGRSAVLFLDLDDFKVVNDGLGHAAGDELLRHVAARLGRALRPGDLCARLGGDEFAVLLPDSADIAHAVARRLVGLVAAPLSVGGRVVHVGVSIGLAFTADGLSGDELLRHADAAMYAAKAAGKNRVHVFGAGLLVDERSAFEDELAVAVDEGQLVVHYQPIVSVADGGPVAVEALVRWQHPTRGLLGPAEFIPLAERTGAIVDIGAHVLRRACAEAADWEGPAGLLAVHVNVSAAQLTEPRFADVVRACLEDFGLAGRLVLEITESTVLDSPAIERAVERLSALGAAIAIDDFGTGYSALSTLRTLPLDIVKIDRSFLAGHPDRTADGAVVEAIIELAGRLGLRVVVEGVERSDQQRFLDRVGADAAQGYLHLRPAPAAEVARWLGMRLAALDRSLPRTEPGPVVPDAGLPDEVVPAGAWGLVVAPPAPRRPG